MRNFHLDRVAEAVRGVGATEEHAAVGILADTEFEGQRDVSIVLLGPECRAGAIGLEDAIGNAPTSGGAFGIREVVSEQGIPLGHGGAVGSTVVGPDAVN